MSDNALLLLVICMCSLLYLKILFKYRPNIKYMLFCDFQFNYKYTQFLYSNTITNMYLNPTLSGSGSYYYDDPDN